MNIVRKVIIKLNLRRWAAVTMFFIGKSALHEVRWFRSGRDRQSVDKDGNPIPWLTYAAIAFLKDRMSRNMTVFEYGSGNSTLWLAKRVKNVTSCEHSKDWYYFMKRKCPKNVELKYINLEYGGRYSNEVAKQKKKFHVIIVDGRDRVNCALNSLTALKNDGVIIWDNTDRPRYKKGIDALLKAGFRRIDFFGLAPIDNSNNVTSIFYRSNNCLDI